MKRKINQDQLVQELTEILSQCDGEFVAEICNKVMVRKVTYIEDLMYEIDDGLPDEPELDPRWTKTI